MKGAANGTSRARLAPVENRQIVQANVRFAPSIPTFAMAIAGPANCHSDRRIIS